VVKAYVVGRSASQFSDANSRTLIQGLSGPADPTIEPREPLPVDIEPSQIPRWGQVVAGILLTPITLLCVVGSGAIFTLPNVRGSPPFLCLAAAITLGSLWTVSLCVRLIFGLGRSAGLFGPLALRVIAVGVLGIVTSGLFTGYYAERPVVGGVMALSYVLVARRFWTLGKFRLAD